MEEVWEAVMCPGPLVRLNRTQRFWSLLLRKTFTRWAGPQCWLKTRSLRTINSLNYKLITRKTNLRRQGQPQDEVIARSGRGTRRMEVRGHREKLPEPQDWWRFRIRTRPGPCAKTRIWARTCTVLKGRRGTSGWGWGTLTLIGCCVGGHGIMNLMSIIVIETLQ